VEVSAELRNGEGAAEGLDQLSEIVTTLSSASRAVETLQFMAADLRRARRRMAPPVQMPEAATAQLSVLYADDHERLLRVAAHDALRRFICCTNKVGANMVPALFNPAEIAGRRLSDVRVYYSRHGGPVKRRHVKAHRERLNGMVDLIGIRDPQLHAKFLAWDSDHVVVSSLNWGSQSGLAQNRMDEVGIYLQGKDLASELVKKFEAVLPSGNDG
jgi:phosphatidylserine/phosphatidylglycerophosphate/cardiolipin synthase-like enzyme